MALEFNLIERAFAGEVIENLLEDQRQVYERRLNERMRVILGRLSANHARAHAELGDLISEVEQLEDVDLNHLELLIERASELKNQQQSQQELCDEQKALLQRQQSEKNALLQHLAQLKAMAASAPSSSPFVNFLDDVGGDAIHMMAYHQAGKEPVVLQHGRRV
jgi:hypothetical protein